MAYYQRAQPYKPGQTTAFKVSRSKIELFTQCPRCFWLDNRLKIKRPNGPPFKINSVIDELFKKEFDTYRAKKQPHPLMVEYKIDAVPYPHKDLNKWRENFVGVQALDAPSNLLIIGAVDDVWVNPAGELMVVDYKATAKKEDITIDADWQMSYKRQMEIYQWLLRQNGFSVSDTGYFVYANGIVDKDGFFNKVEFRTKVIPYTGTSDWLPATLMKIKSCLEADIPAVGTAAMGGECDFCAYARSRTELTIDYLQKSKK